MAASWAKKKLIKIYSDEKTQEKQNNTQVFESM